MSGYQSRRMQVTLILIGIISIGATVLGIGFYSFLELDSQPHDSIRDTTVKVLDHPTAPQGEYVGGQACRRCHESVWEKFQSNSMSKSMVRIGEEKLIEDFERRPAFEVATDCGIASYSVQPTSRGQFHTESLIDKSQQKIYEQRVQVDVAVGTGHEGRSYLLVQNGSLYVSPITWYSQGANWGLTPSYDPGRNVRFERKVTLACIMCHSDGVDVDRDAPNQISLDSIRNLAISCERCHGPGAEHVAFHDTDTLANKKNFSHDPIINPAKLDQARLDSVCWQCHYDAEERVLRYGRIDSDFRPGMKFDEIWVPFTRNENSNQELPSQPVNHVEQIQASRCYQKSNGKLGCTSCHDAHEVPARKDVGKYFRAKCLACHTEGDCVAPTEQRLENGEADSCIICHMSQRKMERLPHTSQTDHRILRKSQELTKTPLDIEVTIHRDSLKNLSQIEQDRAWGIYLAREAERKHDFVLVRRSEKLLTSVLPYVADDPEVLERLGFCESVMNQRTRAKSHFAAILERYPRDERALGQMSDLLIAMNELPAAKTMLNRYLAVNPWHAKFQFQLALVQMRTGELDAAIISAQEAVRVNPGFGPAYRILADIFQKQGKAEEAREQLRIVRSLEPRQ